MSLLRVKKFFWAFYGEGQTFPIPLTLLLFQVLLYLFVFLLTISSQFSSVQSLSHVWPFATPWTTAHQASCPSVTPGAYSNSCPSSRWWHPPISSSLIPFSPHLPSCPAPESFPMTQFFASGGQSIGVSASTSIFSMNTQDWFPVGWTGWISL